MPEPNWPWETDLVNDRVEKKYVLRMPEPYHLMLKFLVEHGKSKSIQRYCWDLIKTKIEEDIDDLTENLSEDDGKSLRQTLREMGYKRDIKTKKWKLKPKT